MAATSQRLLAPTARRPSHSNLHVDNVFDPTFSHLPIRSTQLPKASCPEGALRSGATVCSPAAVQAGGALPSAAGLGAEGRRRVPRAQPAQARLGQSDLVLITARVDAGALRLGHRVTMGCVEGLAQQSPQPWTPRGVSGGWTAVLGLASLLPRR